MDMNMNINISKSLENSIIDFLTVRKTEENTQQLVLYNNRYLSTEHYSELGSGTDGVVYIAFDIIDNEP